MRALCVSLLCAVLGAWTAAAGRTSCVLKGRQNALFGRGGRERCIRTDLAVSEGTIRCRIIDFFGLPASDEGETLEDLIADNY